MKAVWTCCIMLRAMLVVVRWEGGHIWAGHRWEGGRNQVYVVKEPEGVEGGRRRCSRTQGR